MNTGHMGCCGRSDVERFAALADLYPRSSREGQKARARLALAMIGTKARALGDLGTLEKVERGFAQLGTVADDARRTAVAAAISTVRAQRGDGTADRWVTQRAAVRNAAQVDLVLSILSGLVGIAQSVAAGEAAAERTKAAAEGRDVNFSAADTEKALSWVSWMLGGPFPIDVGEKDLRIFNSILNNPDLVRAIDSGLTTARNTAVGLGQTELAGFLGWLKGYYRTMRDTTAAAVAALPVPAPPPPPAEPPPGSGVTPFAWANMTLAQKRALMLRFRVPGTVIPTTEKKSSGALLALPAALLAWYLFK